MTSFCRYYDDNKKLVNYTMDELSKLITDEKNKEIIADLIYRRYYERYLKIFFYKSTNTKTYGNQNGEKKEMEEFSAEYKNGFVIMASCCLVIETLASFLTGIDKTPKKQGDILVNKFFKRADEYGNELKEFSGTKFYGKIRCGILHQGETIGPFKIVRTGKLFEESDNKINASIFCFHLKKFLESYCNELKKTKWDGSIWDNCRKKIGHIINNANKEQKL